MVLEKASRCRSLVATKLLNYSPHIYSSHLSYAVARKTRNIYTRNITDNAHKHHRNKVVEVIVKE